MCREPEEEVPTKAGVQIRVNAFAFAAFAASIMHAIVAECLLYRSNGFRCTDHVQACFL